MTAILDRPAVMPYGFILLGASIPHFLKDNCFIRRIYWGSESRRIRLLSFLSGTAKLSFLLYVRDYKGPARFSANSLVLHCF